MKIAQALIEEGPKWIGFELINHHPATMKSLRREDIERMGDGNQSWGQVDAFGTMISGPAWLEQQIDDKAVVARANPARGS